MANASKKHMGSGTQGKGDGTGALTELPEGILEENMDLSNRDKSQHSDERGLDWASPCGVEGSVRNLITPGGRNGTQTNAKAVHP